MIKFKEHDGKLFKMLDKPVPLKEKNTDVLVQFITHGVIGEYVMEHWLDCNQENVPIFVDSVDSDGDVTVFIENGNEHYGCPFPMFEIIGIFVVEGSKEWALYQMMQWKIVCHKKSPSIMYCKRDSKIMREVRCGCVDFMSIDAWLNGADKSGWQIYKEPKIEPPKEPDYVICKRCGGSQSVPNPAVSNTAYTTCPKCGGTGYEIKEQKPDNLYLNIKTSNPVNWCFDKENLLVLVDDNFTGIVGENVTQEQVGDIAKLLTEPAMQYKVGDWVKYDIDSYLQVVEPSGKDRTLCRTLSGIMVYPYTSCLTKASPSEVVIQIGCLSGTIEDLSYAENGRFWLIGGKTERCPVGMYAILYDEMLDTPTRELVESLLKAQEEEK